MQRQGFYVSAVLVALLSVASSTFAASPPRAGCRPVSKLEYDIAKKENVIISQGRTHAPHRTILATSSLALSGLVREGHHGAMASRRPFSDGCSLPALDAAGHRHPAGLVCLCVGHTPRSLKAGLTQLRVFSGLSDTSGMLPLPARMSILSPWEDHEAALQDHPQR